MAWSLLNSLIAEDVEKLVDNEHIRPRDGDSAISRDTALAIIHAALWLYNSRAGSFASSYARANLLRTMGIDPFEPSPPRPSDA